MKRIQPTDKEPVRWFYRRVIPHFASARARDSDALRTGTRVLPAGSPLAPTYTVTDLYRRRCGGIRRMRGVARGESAIDPTKQKEAIVLREEQRGAARPSNIPALSPRSFLSRVQWGLGSRAAGREATGGRRSRATSCQEEERTCKITRGSRGARELARTPTTVPIRTPAVVPVSRDAPRLRPHELSAARVREVNARLGISAPADALCPADPPKYETRATIPARIVRINRGENIIASERICRAIYADGCAERRRARRRRA